MQQLDEEDAMHQDLLVAMQHMEYHLHQLQKDEHVEDGQQFVWMMEAQTKVAAPMSNIAARRSRRRSGRWRCRQ